MRQNTVFSTKNTKKISGEGAGGGTALCPLPRPLPTPSAPRPPPCWNPGYATDHIHLSCLTALQTTTLAETTETSLNNATNETDAGSDDSESKPIAQQSIDDTGTTLSPLELGNQLYFCESHYEQHHRRAYCWAYVNCHCRIPHSKVTFADVYTRCYIIVSFYLFICSLRTDNMANMTWAGQTRLRSCYSCPKNKI